MSRTRRWNVAALIVLACGVNSFDRPEPKDELPSVLEMQSDGGPGGMGDVVGLALLPDSSILVGDADNAQLVRIDPNGKVLARIGKRGAAMGEFSRLQWVGACGTSTTVHDIALSRLSILDDAQRVTTAKTIPKSFDSRDVAGCLADGRVLILNDSMRPVQGVQKRPLAIAAFDTRTNRADTLRRFHGSDFNFIRHLGTGIPLPLGARTLVSVTNSAVVVAETDRDTLWRYEGNSWHAIPLTGIPAARKPTPIDIERARLVLSWAPRTSQDRAFAPALLNETPTSIIAPRIDALVNGDDGSAWIGLMPDADGHREWIAYDAGGSRVASTQFIWTFEPRMVRGQSWWGVQRDSIGVETVVRYRVSRK